MSDREDIAALLDTVEGVQGYTFRPTVVNTGDAFSLLETMERGPVTDFEVTWRVIIVLPLGEQDAMSWFMDMYQPIAEALEDFGLVERIEPGTLATEAGTRDVMILTVRKEA